MPALVFQGHRLLHIWQMKCGEGGGGGEGLAAHKTSDESRLYHAYALTQGRKRSIWRNKLLNTKIINRPGSEGRDAERASPIQEICTSVPGL